MTYFRITLAAAIGSLLYAAEPNLASRSVQVHRADIIPIYTQFGYNTIVIFPKGEELKDLLAPEAKLWSFSAGPNFLLIKAKGSDKEGRPGQKTSVSVTAASGNVYTFLVQETSNSSQKFDLRVELEQEDADSLNAIAHPQFVPASQAAELAKQLAESQSQLAQTKHDAATSEAREIRHDYEWKTGKESDAFGLKAIYHDRIHTYIEANSQEAPTLYEVKDGKDSIVPYTLDHGRYVASKVIDHGYLRAGKQRLEFRRTNDTV